MQYLPSFVIGFLVASVAVLVVRNEKPATVRLQAPSLWECEPSAIEGAQFCYRAIQVRNPHDHHLELQVQKVLVKDNRATLLLSFQFDTLEKVEFGPGIQIVPGK